MTPSDTMESTHDDHFSWRPAVVLDPVERSSEVVFCVLMAMSITGTLSVATAGRHEVISMTMGAVGCNIAWGLVDAVMYLVRTITNRRRQVRAWHHIRNEEDAQTARQFIQDELPELLEHHASPQVLDALRTSMGRSPLPPVHLLKRDISGAWSVFILVVASTFPVVLPFLFVKDPQLAMRLSNALAVMTLFVAGCALGRFASGHPWRYGAGMSFLGVLLVAVIIALGG